MTAPIGDAYITVRDALSTDADKGKTAREISAETEVGYSRVTELLRQMADTGVAIKEKSGRQVTWTRAAGDPAVDGGTPDADDLKAVVAVAVDDLRNGGPDVGFVAPWDQPDADGMTDGSHAGSPLESSQTAPTADEDADHTDAPADPGTAATVDLTAAQTSGDVLAAMSAISPVPDAPAQAEKAPRTRTAGPAREVRNDFGSGGLQGAVLRYMDEHKADGPFGPYELAQALSAHASSVAYSLKRTTAKGQTVDVTAEKGKPRFRLATSDEARAHADRETAAKAAKTAATAPAE